MMMVVTLPLRAVRPGRTSRRSDLEEAALVAVLVGWVPGRLVGGLGSGWSAFRSSTEL